MFCINCGSRINEGKRFCSQCGTRVGESQPVRMSQPPNMYYRRPVQISDAELPKGKMKYFWISKALILMSLVCWFFPFLTVRERLYGRKEPETLSYTGFELLGQLSDDMVRTPLDSLSVFLSYYYMAALIIGAIALLLPKGTTVFAFFAGSLDLLAWLVFIPGSKTSVGIFRWIDPDTGMLLSWLLMYGAAVFMIIEWSAQSKRRMEALNKARMNYR